MNKVLPVVAVALVALASVVPSPHAALWPDTVRDLAMSLSFARGEAVPLHGPPINFGPHLGPAWPWLQAAVFSLAASLTAASVYVAAVAALKFAFLFGLGRVLSGARLGACIALAAAIPSIAAYHWIVFFHPNWVEAGIAACLLLLAIALKRGSVAWVHAAGATLGLAIQLHPTALFYFPLVVLALVALGVRGMRLAAHVAASVLLVAAWFAPLLLAPGLSQQAGMESGVTRIGEGLRAFNIGEVITVVKTAYWSVPLAIGDTYASAVGVPRWAWIALLGLVGVAGACGTLATALVPGRWRWPFVAGLVLLLAGWVVATAVRTYTSFYLCYFLLPLSAVLAGLALERTVSSTVPAIRWLGCAALGAIVACAVAAAAGAREVGLAAHIDSRLPALADLKHPADANVTATLVTAAARDAVARHACRQPRATTYHGELAYALAASTGLDFRLHCPARAAEMTLLGAPDGRIALTAISSVDAARLGATPAVRFDGLAAFEVKQVIHPLSARPIETEWYHFDQLRDRQPVTRVALAFATRTGEAVMVYRLKPFDSRWARYSVKRDGVEVRAAVSTYNNEVFPAASSPARWTIDFETDAPQWVDVHVF